MKTMKKLFALLLAVLMMVGMLVTTAMAADEITITINDLNANRKYVAYQVFTGDLDHATGILSNVEWGSSVAGDTLITALKAAEASMFVKDATPSTPNPFASVTTAESVAKAMNGWGYNEAPIKNFADVVSSCLANDAEYYPSGTVSNGNVTWQTQGPYKITVDKPGYYLIKDDSDPEHNTTGYTDYLMFLTNNVNVTPKVSVPTFHLMVSNRIDSGFGEAIDAQIDDTLYLKFSGTLPTASFNDYHEYFIRYNITLPAWLKLPSTKETAVNIRHANGDAITAETSRYTVEYGTNTITFSTKNLKDGSSKMNLNDTLEFVVAVKFVQDDTLVYGKQENLGNLVNATMSYSGDPNQKLSTGENITNVRMAKLPDTASVYTYQGVFKKVDGASKEALAGAEFRLYRNVTTSTSSGDETNTYYAIVEKEPASAATYRITGWTKEGTNASIKMTTPEGDSNTKGIFIVKGLDGVAYHVEETKAPEKYTKLDESVPYSITAEITGQSLTSLSGNIDGVSLGGNMDTGAINEAAINNTPGSTLPTTGGIGTTIFYIVGGVLVLGAGAAFVMKKRNEA